MPYFIIIRGSLGCGKSTVAKELAKRLDADYISIDKVLHKNNLDKIAPTIKCIPAENFIKANEIVIPKAEKALKKGKPVIFDACFYHEEPILHLIKRLKHKHYVFTLKAPLSVCIERDSKRSKTHGEQAARDVYRLCFDYGINIDVTQPLKKIVEEIVSHLPTSRTKSL